MSPRSTVTFFAVVLLLAQAAQLQAQSANSENTLRLEEGASSPPASIADLAWLTGYWRGEGLGGDCEEAWGPPIGDRMLGWFSMRKEGALVFSEATTLVEHDGSLVMRVKHFRPDFVGWEEKDDFVSFPLVRLGEREAYFNGLTLRRTDDETLVIYLVLSNAGERSEHQFRLRRSRW